jgi:hypothetical protein
MTKKRSASPTPRSPSPAPGVESSASGRADRAPASAQSAARSSESAPVSAARGSSPALRAPSPALRWIGAVLAGGGLSGAAAYALTQVLGPASSGFAGAWQTTPVATATVAAAPLVAALLTALFGGGSPRADQVATGAPVETPAMRPAPPPPPDRGEAALRLLALMQQEGRLVDFLEEDLAPYSDGQIGSAVRSIHSGCRAVLKERLDLAPILPGAEGATVTVERGFDPAAVRITGNVRGEPPYQGVLRHPGWRSAAYRMPDSMGDRDHTILAPAEVEIL